MTVINCGRSTTTKPWSSLRLTVSFVVLSQLLVLRYLHVRWPALIHPLEPPTTSTSRGASDGLYDGLPLSYHTSLPASSVQCIGETFESNAWMFRSCHYRNLCFDTQEHEFIYVQSSREAALKDALQEAGKGNLMAVSTTIENAKVSLAALQPQNTRKGELELQWIPKVKTQDQLFSTGFYQLPFDVVFVSVGRNEEARRDGPTNLVWDVIYPIYTLLATFGLTKTPIRLFTSPNNIGPPHLFLLGSPVKSTKITPNDYLPQSNLICARQAVAGIGMIADRGYNLPERWRTKDPTSHAQISQPVPVNLFTHNLAQGAILLRGFRDYMLTNILSEMPRDLPSGIIQIAWYGEALEQDTQEVRTKLTLIDPNIHYNQLDFWTPATLKDTATTVSQSSVLLVKCCGADAALAATFLPNGATLIVLCDTTKPKQLSPTWDLVESATYIKTYWVALDQVNSVVQIVQQALSK